jgi:hypothetical protein
MPALVGIQGEGGHVGPPLRGKTWIPVFTGMTEGEPRVVQLLMNHFM